MHDVSVQMAIYERNTFFRGKTCTFRFYIQLTTPTKREQVQQTGFSKARDGFLRDCFQNKIQILPLSNIFITDYLKHIEATQDLYLRRRFRQHNDKNSVRMLTAE